MDGLTINEAAETTGWSPRMLRYIESAGLVELPRTPKGYRIFGPGELQRLRTLRELLTRFDCALSDVAFAKRLASDAELRAAVDQWFAERPEKPAEVASDAWLSWEQRKHERLLATRPTPESMEPSVA
jgi:MerR family transcriptional regulator, copper efflux regulator